MNNEDKRKLALSEVVLTALAIILLGVIVWLAWWLPSRNHNQVNSFAACVSAGGRIQESYPEVCVADNGKSFTNPNQKINTRPDGTDGNDSDTTTEDPAYLDIKEWGVRVPLTDASRSLWYKYQKNTDYEGVFFGLTDLDNVGGCKDGVGIAMNRSTAKNEPPYNIENPAPFKTIGDYTYYLAYANGGTCYDENDPAQMTKVNTVTGGQPLKTFMTSSLQNLQQ